MESLDTIQGQLQRHLSAADLQKMSAEFRALKCNAARVFFAYNILNEHNLFPDVVRVEKSDAESEERRSYGNHVFVKLKKNSDAVKHYNKAVAYAKTDDKLAVAYANRSAVFFQEKYYVPCLNDINYALKSNPPASLIPKLMERQKRALQEAPLRQAPEEYFLGTPEISHVNKTIPCACDCVEMQCSDTLGRHVIAKRDIKPGHVIAIEPPYTNILLYNFYLTHCHNCLKPSLNLIPCEKCPLTLYCGDACRQSSWGAYHRYECPILDTLHQINATKLQLLALRIVLTLRNTLNSPLDYDLNPIDNPLDYDLNPINNPLDYDLNPINNPLNSPLNPPFNNVYKSASYPEIHNLITNEEHRTVSDLFARATVAATLIYLLEKKTSFFSDVFPHSHSQSDCNSVPNIPRNSVPNIPRNSVPNSNSNSAPNSDSNSVPNSDSNSAPNPDCNSASSSDCEREIMRKNCALLLLKHLQTAPSNMHEISELRGRENTGKTPFVAGYEITEIGAGAYGFLSLLNHSCYPNVVRHCHGDVVVLRAVKTIRKGEQLYDNYGYHFALMEKPERQSHLKEQYLFDCACEACVNDYPLYTVLSKGHNNFVVSENELNELLCAKRSTATKLIPILLNNAETFEKEPEKHRVEILDNQEVMKQCFAILGNKNTLY